MVREPCSISNIHSITIMVPVRSVCVYIYIEIYRYIDIRLYVYVYIYVYIYIYKALQISVKVDLRKESSFALFARPVLQQAAGFATRAAHLG